MFPDCLVFKEKGRVSVITAMSALLVSVAVIVYIAAKTLSLKIITDESWLLFTFL